MDLKLGKNKNTTVNSTQQLIGFKSFGRNGLQTDGHGELVYYTVSPTNISVLSSVSVGTKVRHLMQLLTAQPDIEIICTDDCECFDGNREYLNSRSDDEQNPAVRALIQKDLSFLDDIQIQMSTARRFMFAVRLRNESDEQSFANLNRIEKSISDQGFEVRRAKKEDIKRFLSIYFGRTATDEELPDIDGEAAVMEEVKAQKWVIPD